MAKSVFIPPPSGMDFREPFVQGVPKSALHLDHVRPSKNGLVSIKRQYNEAINIPLATGVASPLLIFGHPSAAATSPATRMIQYRDRICVGTTSAVVAYALAANLDKAGNFCNFATGAGQFTIYTDGLNVPGIYNGAWAAVAWAGIPAGGTSIFQALPYRGRLYLADNSGKQFWYLPAGAIAGAATAYSVASLMNDGGQIVALGNFTRDGGQGAEDFFVVYTSMGEVLVFSGNDPAAADWAVVGVYKVAPPPVSTIVDQFPEPRLLARLGGDLLIFTGQGIFRLSDLFSGKDISEMRSISAPIDPSLNLVPSFNGRPFWMQVLKTARLLVVGLPKLTWAMDLDTMEWFTFGSLTPGASDYNFVTCFYENSMSSEKFVIGIKKQTGEAGYFFYEDDFGASNFSHSWMIWTQYGRLGQMTDIRGLAVRPFVVASDYGGFTPTSTNSASGGQMSVGCAYDLYARTNNSNAELTPFGRVGNIWEDRSYNGVGMVYGPTAGHRFSSWKTVLQKTGSAIAIRMEGAHGGANPLTNLKFYGWDLLYEPVDPIGP